MPAVLAILLHSLEEKRLKNMKGLNVKVNAKQLELPLEADVIDLATIKPVPRFNVGDTVYIPCLSGLDEIEKVTSRKIKKIEVAKSEIDGKYHVHYYITGHKLPFSYGADHWNYWMIYGTPREAMEQNLIRLKEFLKQKSFMIRDEAMKIGYSEREASGLLVVK